MDSHKSIILNNNKFTKKFKLIIGYSLIFLQIFIRRVVFIPSSYLVPYIYFFRISLTPITSFYITYIIYSLTVTTNFKSLIIYALLFLGNTFVYNSFTFPSQKIWGKITSFHYLIRISLISGCFISFFLFSINLNILPNKIYLTHFNPLNALNLNSYIFIVYFYAFLSISLKKTKDYWFAFTLLLISDSRTGFILTFFSFLQLLLNYKIITSELKIKKYIFVGGIMLVSIITSLIFATSFDSRLINNIQNSAKFFQSDFKQFDETKQLLNKVSLNNNSFTESNEFHRICLTAQNIKHISITFPFGTGIGLGSYQNSLEKNNLVCDVAKKEAIRGHNFYISYLAEMGIFFFPLLIFFLSHLKYKSSFFIIVGLMISLIGQEYITMPYIWMIFGLSRKLNQE